LNLAGRYRGAVGAEVALVVCGGYRFADGQSRRVGIVTRTKIRDEEIGTSESMALAKGG
jgi:hypothetical protein